MAESIEFRYQLGAVLPKLDSAIGAEVKTIFTEFANTLKAGTFEEGEMDLASVKDLFLKNIDIMLDKIIIPAVEKDINPPVKEPPAAKEKPAEKVDKKPEKK